MDVNEELKFFEKIQKKIRGIGGCLGWRVRIAVYEELKCL